MSDLNHVRLYTRGDDQWASRLVAAVPVPPMQPPPEVIIWGARMFVATVDPEKYVEGVAWVVPANV